MIKYMNMISSNQNKIINSYRLLRFIIPIIYPICKIYT